MKVYDKIQKMSRFNMVDSNGVWERAVELYDLLPESTAAHKGKLPWKVHLAELCHEIGDNGGSGVHGTQAPLNILMSVMGQFAYDSATGGSIDGIALSAHLALLNCFDPTDKENYDPDFANEVIAFYQCIKTARREYLKTAS